jgi:hypothetical protein
MAETRRPATLHFYQGASGPTLLIQMFEESHLRGLKEIFRQLSAGLLAEVSLRKSRIVSILDGVDDLLFVLSGTGKDPSRMVRKIGGSENAFRFQFQRGKEGWLECSGLLDGLKLPGHHYLNRGYSEDAVIILSYQENLTPSRSSSSAQPCSEQ